MHDNLPVAALGENRVAPVLREAVVADDAGEVREPAHVTGRHVGAPGVQVAVRVEPREAVHRAVGAAARQVKVVVALAAPFVAAVHAAQVRAPAAAVATDPLSDALDLGQDVLVHEAVKALVVAAALRDRGA